MKLDNLEKTFPWSHLKEHVHCGEITLPIILIDNFQNHVQMCMYNIYVYTYTHTHKNFWVKGELYPHNYPSRMTGNMQITKYQTNN